MMKVGNVLKVLDPYEWLPGHGETAVRIRTEGIDLAVDILYDGTAGSSERQLRFASTCCFYREPFPGPSILNIDLGAKLDPFRMGELVEYPASEPASIWKAHYGGQRIVRHFKIIFLAENFQLTVFASGVSLSDCVRSL